MICSENQCFKEKLKRFSLGSCAYQIKLFWIWIRLSAFAYAILAKAQSKCQSVFNCTWPAKEKECQISLIAIKEEKGCYKLTSPGKHAVKQSSKQPYK